MPRIYCTMDHLNCKCCTIEMYNKIKNNGMFIEKVTLPCLTIQFLAVSQNGMSIKFIHQQNLAIQLVAIHENVHSSFYFDYSFSTDSEMETLNMAIANQYYKSHVDPNSIPEIFQKTIRYLENPYIYSEEEYKF
jgi:hypothetical protein